MIDYPKLDPEIKDKWIVALESGEYKQGIGALAIPPKSTGTALTLSRSDNSSKEWNYCCMGVLGCIVGIPNEIMEKYGQFSQLVDGTDDEIDEEIVQRVRDNIPAPLLINSGVNHLSISHICINMNDEKDKTFPEIAEWIKINL